MVDGLDSLVMAALVMAAVMAAMPDCSAMAAQEVRDWPVARAGKVAMAVCCAATVAQGVRAVPPRRRVELVAAAGRAVPRVHFL
jgi:hypothetical protein